MFGITEEKKEKKIETREGCGLLYFRESLFWKEEDGLIASLNKLVEITREGRMICRQDMGHA